MVNLLNCLIEKRTSQVTNMYFITQGMGQSSMFLTFCTVVIILVGTIWALGRVGGGRVGIPGLHPCLLKCNLLVEILKGDYSFEGNIPSPSPSLYETCFFFLNIRLITSS